MSDGDRFKKLELKPGVRDKAEEEPAEKTRKQRLRELDRKLTLDSAVDRALEQEQESTESFNKKMKTLAIIAGGAALIFFLASHRLFGLDSLLGFVLKVLSMVMLPLAIYRVWFGK